MGEKVINAALLGLGTVGTGVYKVLKGQEVEMTSKIGCQVKIRKILFQNFTDKKLNLSAVDFGFNVVC